ncbi:MAG: LLM class flavin-dependent oxidoreductase [Pseudomonadota bacterium]|nr:LLM class flavin-dependent oxidoreductase [Pseudomonadota bacterium]
MPINILGMIGVSAPATESTVHIVGGGIDPQYITDFSKAHEDAGFDAVLIGHSSSSADGFAIAQHVAYQTERIKILLAHRPGFAAPTQAARRVATLDNLINGRLLLHIITGGVDADQQRDGDFLGHDERYQRTDEYLQVMRQVWTAQGPFDFEGKYYQVRRASSEVTAAQSPHVPLWFGGVSEAAKPIGAKHCGTYALFGESLGLVSDLMRELDGLAAGHNRSLRYNLSFRPIIAETEDAAWKKARQILHNVETTTKRSTKAPEAETAKRLSRLIEEGEVHDERLWVPIAAAAQGTGNSTALVGTPEQVAEAIAKYYDLGVAGVLIRGFDPFNDAVEFGKELIPWIRDKIRQRDEG